MYTNSKIYRLQCEDGHFYTGSTTQSLKRRLAEHKSKSITLDYKVYKYINSIGWDTVRIELVENINCVNRIELRKIEDSYIEKDLENKLCLNVRYAYRTPEQNRLTGLATRKIYRQVHKAEIAKYIKSYYQLNKESIKKYQIEHRIKKMKLIYNESLRN